MKALTLTQPWATLVAILVKKIETRSWNTNYCGPLAIHAAKGFPDLAKVLCFGNNHFKFALDAAGYKSYKELSLGMIIATCELVRVERITINTTLPPMPEYEFGSYDVGRYMWFLENAKILDEPIPAKGSLGLWEWKQ